MGAVGGKGVVRKRIPTERSACGTPLTTVVWRLAVGPTAAAVPAALAPAAAATAVQGQDVHVWVST
jgi:hypothetical protein